MALTNADFTTTEDALYVVQRRLITSVNRTVAAADSAEATYMLAYLTIVNAWVTIGAFAWENISYATDSEGYRPRNIHKMLSAVYSKSRTNANLKAEVLAMIVVLKAELGTV